jgi:hypothetical protein
MSVNNIQLLLLSYKNIVLWDFKEILLLHQILGHYSIGFDTTPERDACILKFGNNTCGTRPLHFFGTSFLCMLSITLVWCPGQN